MEQLNHLVFLWINATPASPEMLIKFASFLANDLIIIVPLLIVGLWLWGQRENIGQQRVLVSKTAIALLFAMATAKSLSLLFPHARPFVEGFGHTFIQHAPDSSFPSDHGTAIFTFALSFLFWHRLWSGAILMVTAVGIAWSRVYLGVHWPLDMVGGLLVGMLGCLFAQLVWNLFGEQINAMMCKVYRFGFAFPIKKGWVQN
ncbi:undecaprenyl-diphosphate phosphatase [Rahnella sp. PAMC25617]|jgi:undecaprenyl-diphosphatase|uniref:undecaprenyl-diphosphate phosphatase n=1 Tax=Rahnella TaxID=34037 RepID=UPI00101BEE65|nr:undecaprenyl-diphosphate phosphatase [Rahnella variigena]RYJ12320.1 undecaprenyl-diphosphate phosphatase [Rahnella variigena]